jgi:3-dehydrosphinganine reductase
MALTGYFEELTANDFAKSMNVNYFGVVNVARQYLTIETQGEDRKLIAVSSMAAAVPFIGYCAYAPSKAALRAFTDVLRNEFADVAKTSIHICFPPDMDTPGFAKENEAKPLESKTVWPECFNEVFKAEEVAAGIIDDVSENRYHLHSPDFFGNYIVSRGWGHYPRNFIMLEMVLAPIFVLFHELMV